MRAALLEVPRPSLAVLRHAWPVAALLTWVLLAYDTGVLDLEATKRAAFQFGVAVWGIYAVVVGLSEPQRRPAVGVPLFVLAWALLPGLLRAAPSHALVDLPVYFGFLAMALVLLRGPLQAPRAWPGLLWSLTGLSLVLSLSTVLEALWLGGEPAFAGAPVVTLGNPNHLGAALVLLMPAVLSCIEHERRLRPGVVAVAALTLLAIALTGSHLAVLGAAALIGITAAVPTLSRAQRLLVIGVLIAAVAGGVALHQHTALGAAPADATPAATSDSLERSAAGRLYLLERGLEIVQAAPLRGVGVGEYAWAFAVVQAEHLEAHPEALELHTRLEHAHNDPLELLAEFGAVGVLGLLAGLWLLRRAARQRPEPADLEADGLRATLTPLFAVLGVALFALVSLGHFALYAPQLAVLGAVYVACLPSRRVALSPGLSRALLAVTLLLLALGAAITMRVYYAERLLVRGLSALAQGELDAAEAALSRAQSEHPSGKVLFYRGTLALERGEVERAVELLGTAAYLLPYAEVHHNHAIALCQAGEVEHALERFDQALRLDPGHEASAQAREACRAALTPDPSP